MKEKLLWTLPLIFVVGCGSRDVLEPETLPALPSEPPRPTATDTATVTATITATKTNTSTATATAVKAVKTETRTPPPPTKTATRTATPRPTETALVGGDELPLDQAPHKVRLAPGQWVPLIINRQPGATDILLSDDPGRKVEVVLQSPQQANQTDNRGQPKGSKGSSCDQTDCDTIVSARGQESGKYLLFLRNPASSLVEIKLRSITGPGGCPPGTHNSGPYEEPLGGKVVTWIGWCVSD